MNNKRLKALRERLSEAQNHRCCHCGGDIRNKATLEHVKRRRDGGRNSYQDCAASCKVCNRGYG